MTTQAETRFEVEYTYYQYNSGAADNGTYTKTQRCATAAEAMELARRINAEATEDVGRPSIEYASDEEKEAADELHHDLIPWDGYFISARAYEVKLIPLSAEVSEDGR